MVVESAGGARKRKKITRRTEGGHLGENTVLTRSEKAQFLNSRGWKKKKSRKGKGEPRTSC